jgi:cytochrome c5
MFRRSLLLVLVTASLAHAAETGLRSAPPPPPPQMLPAAAHPLIWDAMEKKHDARPGEETTDFVFSVTNTGDKDVEIVRVHPSCSCTVAKMPAFPWILAPGEKSSFTARMDFAGKHGRFSKTIQVESTRGIQTVTATVNIPEMDEAMRLRNQELARKNRQIVFQNDCASCHAAPLVGKKGAELFKAACGICHMASPPASMVPSLLVARERRDAAYWLKWISEGKEGTLMPAFDAKHGGPLNPEQIGSLVEYVTKNLPSEPESAPAAAPVKTN